MANGNLKNWQWRDPKQIEKQSLHVEVIADYAGGHATDHAFSEVRNHFLRFDKNHFVNMITDHPVYAFSTLETGYWIAQEALHSEHKNLVVFSNTAPRGEIKWLGESKQFFVCAILKNKVPVFAVHAGYNLSFIKDRIDSMWEVNVPNIGTQFRSRDQYPEATMAILNGDLSAVGKKLDVSIIPDVPPSVVCSTDGYGNIKTSIRQNKVPAAVAKSPVIRVTINGYSHFALNTLVKGVHGQTGDLQLVVGSSGGKNNPYVEIVRLMGRAVDDFRVLGPNDNIGKVVLEAVKV